MGVSGSGTLNSSNCSRGGPGATPVLLGAVSTAAGALPLAAVFGGFVVGPARFSLRTMPLDDFCLLPGGGCGLAGACRDEGDTTGAAAVPPVRSGWSGTPSAVGGRRLPAVRGDESGDASTAPRTGPLDRFAVAVLGGTTGLGACRPFMTSHPRTANRRRREAGQGAGRNLPVNVERKATQTWGYVHDVSEAWVLADMPAQKARHGARRRYGGTRSGTPRTTRPQR